MHEHNADKCLTYSALQKFYNSLSNLLVINPDDYIFANIPKIDAFFQEFRNITFTMQKHFNTPELKQFYEITRDKYLSDDRMRWFIDKRNMVVKENPFKLEKAISLKIYTASNGYDELKTFLSIDIDRNLSELLDEINCILDEYYKNSVEVFFSVFVIFIENGNELDIFDQIIFGIKKMWGFISETIKSYPCNCEKCKTLMEIIISSIDKIDINYRMLFLQDCSYHNGKIQKGSRINGQSLNRGNYEKNINRFSLENSPLYGKDTCNDDIILLKKWAVNHIIILDAQQKLSAKEPEILATFCLIFDDNTAELTEMFGGTLKTTYYRKINEIAARVKIEKIRAILYVCETVTYSLDQYYTNYTKSANERQQESKGTVLNNLIVSKKLDKIMRIGIDYSRINDKEYLINQVNNPEKMDDNFLIAPIFKAMKN